MKKALILITLIGLMAACKKDDEPDLSGASPIVKILTPANNTTYKNGDTMFISAIAYDDKKIANVEVRVRHKASGINLFDYSPEITSSDTIRIDTFYKIESPIAATGVFTVEAADDDGNNGKAEVTITIKN